MNSCPFKAYRDLFGKPGTGFHAYKFKGTSIFDYFVIIAGAFLVTYLTDIPLVLATIGLLVAGIIFHVLFAVPSRALTYLGLQC
jgi:hypothetical protein